MEIVHLYTGDDGESHIETLDVASHPEFTARRRPVTGNCERSSARHTRTLGREYRMVGRVSAAGRPGL